MAGYVTPEWCKLAWKVFIGLQQAAKFFVDPTYILWGQNKRYPGK
jgi:hypothetical protein